MENPGEQINSIQMYDISHFIFQIEAGDGLVEETRQRCLLQQQRVDWKN
ncbi:MAG: hypothetical protein ACLU6P_13850 [Roseburia intestinalis]